MLFACLFKCSLFNIFVYGSLVCIYLMNILVNWLIACLHVVLVLILLTHSKSMFLMNWIQKL